MGINAEFVLLLTELRERGELRGGRVVELGAQDVSAAPEVVSMLLSRAGLGSAQAVYARDLYRRFGFTTYRSIDNSGYLDSSPLDLNRDLRAQGLSETYDLVTNAGTLEHCFDQYNAFRNAHNLCEEGGLFIHVLPTQGQVNHAFYNYHPRFVWELCAANDYELVTIYYSIDFRPKLFKYSVEQFKIHQDRDVMLYVVLRKNNAGEFVTPADRIFSQPQLVAESDFRSWILTTWENALGREMLEP